MLIFFLAIAAGFLTILAPCILPILPILLGTSNGRSKYRPLLIILGFVGSFSLVGAALATAGTFLGISSGTFRIIAVVLLLLFGFALLFEGVYEKLSAMIQPALARLSVKVSGGSATKTDALSGLLVGISLGFIWTPCAGPILGTIFTLASKTKDYLTTMLLMLAYAIGAGVPMLAIAYGSRGLQTKLKGIGSHQRTLNKIFGVLVILTAIAIATGYDTVVQTWLSQFYPSGTGTLFNL